jgi:hypothetical protein
MNESNSIDNVLEKVSKIMLLCFGMIIILLLFWFCFLLIGSDWVYGIHSKMFDITMHDFDLMNYYGMAFVKISSFMFFLFPYIAIRLILKRRKE